MHTPIMISPPTLLAHLARLVWDAKPPRTTLANRVLCANTGLCRLLIWGTTNKCHLRSQSFTKGLTHSRSAVTHSLTHSQSSTHNHTHLHSFTITSHTFTITRHSFSHPPNCHSPSPSHPSLAHNHVSHITHLDISTYHPACITCS